MTTTTTAATTGSGYHAVVPKRLLDTRDGTGVGGKRATIAPHGVLKLPLAGSASAPGRDGEAVATVNVTAVSPTSSGFLTVYDDSNDRPATSNLNFTAGSVVANLATVQGRTLDIYNGSSGTTDVLVDLQGYYTPAAGDEYHPVTPVRVLDTRTTGAHTVPAHGSVIVQLTGVSGSVSQGATAAALNITAAGATAQGFLTAFPGGSARPAVSNLNFGPGRPVPNLALVPLGADGTVTIYNGSSAPVAVIADLDGYYSPEGGLSFTPMAPMRVHDTRPCCSLYPQYTETLFDSGLGDAGIIDPHPAKAALVNTTVTAPTAPGFLTMWPTGADRPTVSSVNFAPGDTVANLGIIQLGSDKGYFIFNGSWGRTDYIADVTGFFS